jgi:hypothetical protein
MEFLRILNSTTRDNFVGLALFFGETVCEQGHFSSGDRKNIKICIP